MVNVPWIDGEGNIKETNYLLSRKIILLWASKGHKQPFGTIFQQPLFFWGGKWENGPSMIPQDPWTIILRPICVLSALCIELESSTGPGRGLELFRRDSQQQTRNKTHLLMNFLSKKHYDSHNNNNNSNDDNMKYSHMRSNNGYE